MDLLPRLELASATLGYKAPLPQFHFHSEKGSEVSSVFIIVSIGQRRIR